MQCTRVALAARTAGAALAALLLALALADTAPAAGPHARAGGILLPSAGWDGRPIRAPHRHDAVRTSAADRPLSGWSAGPVALGTGFHRPGGSERVREVQRRLTRLGYHVGPVDGLFGRRTRASVAWFQVKHGLEVTGRATLVTVGHLRVRTGAAAPPAPMRAESRPVAQRGPEASRPPAWEAFNQLVGPRPPAGDGASARETWSRAEIALAALVAMNLLLLLALVLQRRSARPGAAEHAAAPPEERTEPQPETAEERRAGRRFAPPDPAASRRTGRVPIGARDEETGARP